ncbi:hypothetical protein [Bradyrhizobium sp. USDA 3364]
MTIIDPICLIDNHSLTISSGKGADGLSPAAQVHPKPTEDLMSIRSTILAAALTLASLGAAHASTLRPIEGQSIHLGDVSGVVYYTVEPDGYRVVTTLAHGEAGTPIRFVSVLAPGQRALLSTPNQAGALEISRNGAGLTVRKSGALSD